MTETLITIKQLILNGVLTLSCITSQNGNIHLKNLVVFAARFLKHAWPFWDVIN